MTMSCWSTEEYRVATKVDGHNRGKHNIDRGDVQAGVDVLDSPRELGRFCPSDQAHEHV